MQAQQIDSAGLIIKNTEQAAVASSQENHPNSSNLNAISPLKQGEAKLQGPQVGSSTKDEDKKQKKQKVKAGAAEGGEPKLSTKNTKVNKVGEKRPPNDLTNEEMQNAVQDGGKMGASQTEADLKKKRESKQEVKKYEKVGPGHIKQGTLFFATKIKGVIEPEPVLPEIKSGDQFEEEKVPLLSQEAIMADPSEAVSLGEGVPIVEKKRGRKPKDQSIQVKELHPVEVHEKVREWKDRREQYAAILRAILSNGHAEARENFKNCPHQQNLNILGESKITLDEGVAQLAEEIVRIGQENKKIANENAGSLMYTHLTEGLKKALLKTLGPIIESSPLNLENLSTACLQLLNSRLSSILSSQDQPMFTQLIKLLTDIICGSAERKAFGVKPKDCILYVDESPDALWHWEINEVSLLPPTLLQEVSQARAWRAILSQKVKSLDKLISLIDKAVTLDKDLPRIIEEFEKYNKVLRKEQAQILQQAQKEAQLKEKEKTERDKAEAKERERAEKQFKEQEKERERLAKEAEKSKLLREKEEAKEHERQAREQERLQKEELVKAEREAKEREKKEREENKERERIAKEQERERDRLAKEEDRAKKEAERFDRKRIEEEKKAELDEQKQRDKELADKKALEAQKPKLTLFNFMNKQPQVAKKPLTSPLMSQSGHVSYEPCQESQKPIKRPLEGTWLEAHWKVDKHADTQAMLFKQSFSLQFKYHISKQPAYVSKLGVERLAADMRLYKSMDSDFKTYYAKDRKKSIIIDDSMMKYLGFFEKRSMLLNPRNPIRKDETIVDYEMDSEEEWNEQNGEDVAADNKQDEDEDDEVDKLLREDGQNEEEEGFIVPDDYLSACELNLSQSQRSSLVQAELAEKRKVLAKRYNRNKIQGQMQHYIFELSTIMPKTCSSPVSSNGGLYNYFEEFRAVSFPKDRHFPIRLKPLEPNEEEKQNGASKGSSVNPLTSRLAELIKIMHGSFESKQKILEDFNQRYPDCSKKSIEAKMRDLFEKDKKDADPRQRWYATESTLIEFNLQDNEELKALFEQRLQEVLSEVNKAQEEVLKQKEEQNRLKEEKRDLERQAREAERLERERTKELDRLEKERVKENDRLEKERVKEQERMEKERAKEAERQAKEQQREQERLAKLQQKELQKEYKAKALKTPQQDADMIESIQVGEQNRSAEQVQAIVEQPKKTAAFNLNKFFKPMNAEEKQRILINELAKVQQELQEKRIVSEQPTTGYEGKPGSIDSLLAKGQIKASSIPSTLFIATHTVQHTASSGKAKEESKLHTLDTLKKGPNGISKKKSAEQPDSEVKARAKKQAKPKKAIGKAAAGPVELSLKSADDRCLDLESEGIESD